MESFTLCYKRQNWHKPSFGCVESENNVDHAKFQNSRWLPAAILDAEFESVCHWCHYISTILSWKQKLFTRNNVPKTKENFEHLFLIFRNFQDGRRRPYWKKQLIWYLAQLGGIYKCDTWLWGILKYLISFLMSNLIFELNFKMAASGHFWLPNIRERELVIL